jgi:hypothetical protein
MKGGVPVDRELNIEVNFNLSAQSRPSWPKPPAASIASSSEAIPAFPPLLNGYRSEDGKDFWGKPFVVRGAIRVFQGNGWQGIPNFPESMNGCSAGIFMIRWRSAYPNDDLIQSSVRPNAAVPSRMEAKTGGFGYMSGTNCVSRRAIRNWTRNQPVPRNHLRVVHRV